MNSRDTLLHCASGGGAFQTSPFSAFHFLRNYNCLLPHDVTADFSSKSLLSAAVHLLTDSTVQLHEPEKLPPIVHTESDRSFVTLPPKPYFPWQPNTTITPDLSINQCNLISPSPVGSAYGSNYKRQRGEKKPIPAEQKDDKYFERRRRNNQAAKKSRDARKFREDQVALKAAILEHENAILRAQILTLRDEVATLRRLLMEKKVSEI
ncbi:hypothetical protein RI129_001051 [Pyrocoelia pectoralis]|uniref:BZIP domain-containing protein n=1 Tax=Pyrocoelia pectoralis TaxID=417401 RepID=A0AAN7VK17_9COLE